MPRDKPLSRRISVVMKELKVSVQLPHDVPAGDQGLQEAHRAGLESAVIKLWEAGHLSTREAAKKLQLSYQGYLSLLTQRGLPLMRQEPRPEVIDSVLERLREESA